MVLKKKKKMSRDSTLLTLKLKTNHIIALDVIIKTTVMPS